MNKIYKVNIVPYEFKTRKGEHWTKQDILDEHFSKGDYDSYTVATFINYADAVEYIERKLRSPYEAATNLGWVILGEIFELDEYDGEELINSETFAKGMEE